LASSEAVFLKRERFFTLWQERLFFYHVQKPAGLELVFSQKPEHYFTFLFLFFFRRRMLLFSFQGSSYGNGNQTPPSTAEKNDCSDSGNYYFSRSAVAVLRHRTATLDRE
jgi:hypothetical protein